MYEYRCHMIRVVNGNTVDALIDLGFNVTIRQNIKLFGVDDSSEAKTDLIKLLPKEFICHTMFSKRNKIGRVFGIVFSEDEAGQLININDELIQLGYAKLS